MKEIPADFSPARVLVIQLRQIGDALMTTPALRALRKRWPQARLAYLAEPLPALVLAGNPNLDELIIRQPRSGVLEPLNTIRKVRAGRFELVIDFLANPRTALISLLSGAKVTLSFAGNPRSVLYSHPVPPEGIFSGAQKLSLLRVLGVSGESLEMDMPVPEAARKKMEAWFSASGLDRVPRPLVCLEPFQKWPALTYPASAWIKVCEAMVEKWSAAVVVCWGPGREPEARAMVESSPGRLFLAPPTTLHELAALYQKGDLWVGVDGGPRHIAAAQRLPTFAVLGPSDDAWTPPGPRHLSVAKSLPCRPCNRRVCPEPGLPCMREFPPEEVFARLDEFFRGLETK